jgi:hypothetical protein
LTQSQRDAESQRRRRGLKSSLTDPFDAKPKRRKEPEKKTRAIVLLDRPLLTQSQRECPSSREVEI